MSLNNYIFPPSVINFYLYLHISDAINDTFKNYVIHKKKGSYSCPEGFYDITDRCYLNHYDTILKKVRGLSEVILVIWSIIYLGIAVREFTFLPRDVFMQNMVLCPSR